MCWGIWGYTFKNRISVGLSWVLKSTIRGYFRVDIIEKLHEDWRPKGIKQFSIVLLIIDSIE